MQTLWQDLRYGARMLLKQPGFSLIAILTLALGIGANTALFSVVTSVLLAPLPFAESERLARLVVTRTLANGQQLQSAVPEAYFHAVRERSQLVERVAAQRFRNLTLTGTGEPERVVGIGVSDQWLETLGVQPLLGRGFSAQEQAAGSGSRVALISFGFWQRRFGGEAAIIGRELRLDEQSYTVIGVLPAQFRYPYEADLWLPMTTSPMVTSPGDLNVPARLKPGVTAAQFNEELKTIAAQLEREAADNANKGLLARPFAQEFRRDPNRSIAALLAAVGFVLLIACVNVACLQLARSQSRRREMAVRAALGASRGRQTRQLLTESVLLALLGGACGVALSLAAGEALTQLIPSRLGEVIQQVRVDARVLGFSVAVCLLTGVLFGLAPALRLSQLNPVNVLKDGGRAGSGSGGRLLRALVIAEVALAVVLLIGTGLMMQNFARLLRADVGYDAANLLKLNVSLSQTAYREPARRIAATQQMLEKLEAIPGVSAAAVTTLHPIPRTTTNTAAPLSLAAQTDPVARPPVVNLRLVSPSYFRTLGLRLVQGRAFTAQDNENAAPVLIVNQSAARRFWPAANPLGQAAKPARYDDARTPWHTVVGVVNDIAEPNQEMRETVYQVYAQGTAAQDAGVWSAQSLTLLVRGATDSATLVQQIRQAVRAVDANAPLFEVASLEAALAEPLGDQRLGTFTFIGFGAFGLLMAVLGTYGVLAFSVNQRLPEFGIRLALGAPPVALLRLVMKEGMRLVVVGLAVGAALALLPARYFAGVTSEISPRDPLTFAAVGLVLLLAGGLACWLPARRATKVDPLIALKCE